MSYPSALENNPKVIFFTDFDGTITQKDTNDFMTDNLGFGEKRRRQLNIDCLEGKVDFRDTFKEMVDSIATPFPECIEKLCQNITLDPHFEEFYTWARSNGVPVIVLSSGMTEVISSLLQHLLGPPGKDIPIVCNEKIDDSTKPGGWTIQFHDESGFGHDKSLTIRPYREHFDQRPNEPRPTMLYAGDGVSDLSAARETDLLFAKKGHDLITYCEREGAPFTIFEDWSSILKTTKEIFEGKKTVQEAAKEGLAEAQAASAEKATTN